jgi:hypothetical protein
VPAVLWALGGIIWAIPLIAVVLMVLNNDQLPGTRWSLAGVLLLFVVFELVFLLKTAQSFLNWKDPD